MKGKIFKSFDLKKFIKLLQPQVFDNQKQIYLNFLQSCSTKKESANQIEERWSKSGFEDLLYSWMISGKFFPMMSDNFKLEEKKSFEGNEFGNVMDGYDESITFFLISSKVNKTFYIVVYINNKDGNDGFYVHKKFKTKKQAKNLIKKLSDQQKKYVNSMNKMNKEQDWVMKMTSLRRRVKV